MKYLYYLFIITLLFMGSCQKEWLDKKTDKKLVIPKSLKDLQALLDNSTVMNSQNSTYFGEISADDFYITSDRWNSLTLPREKNAYIWANDIYEGLNAGGWWRPYQTVLYANLVLESLEKIKHDKAKSDFNNIKGSALFYRSWVFFHMAQVYCKPYDKSTANLLPGIPLRMESDINIVSERVSIKKTYDQIISDLKLAIQLLSEYPLVKTRPSKIAAMALLSKTYLQMEDYQLALSYADSFLELNNKLIDYNELNIDNNFPFLEFNEEVVFHATMDPASIFNPSTFNIDSVLFDSYENDDLRKKAYFRDNNGAMTFKGSYAGTRFFFTGIATDELYLIKAECHARLGEIDKALLSLNNLLSKRYVKNRFTELSLTNLEEVLRAVLDHRRKELLFRGIRWADLRRLNKDERFEKTLERVVNNITYSLIPNSDKYVLPIPEEVIVETGMEQNYR